MQIFPDSVTSLWNKWELRVLVTLSLLWQISLIILGSQRKYTQNAFISCSVWILYLTADSLATLSLGHLANNQQGNDSNNNNNISKSIFESKGQVLQALWAPFLLLHLGGPDTITAYALEDNTLWLRHLLGLIFQVTIAFYIFLRSWGNNPLTFIAIPVFVSGVIKYLERTYALRAASPDEFEDSLLSSRLTQVQGFDKTGGVGDAKKDFEHVLKGQHLFRLVKHLYADLSLTFAEGRQSCSLMVKEDESEKELKIEGGFDLVEVQLGFLFDVLYTKAAVIYSSYGLVLRLISVSAIVSALVAFHIVIDSTYSSVDVGITYALFVGAIALEIYAFVSLVLSDWTTCWLAQQNNPLANCVLSLISCCRNMSCYKNRWSVSMAQLNLVDFCLNNSHSIGTTTLRNIYFHIKLFYRKKSVKVEADLKQLISEMLGRKYKAYKEKNFDGNFLKELLSQRGKGAAGNEIGWSFEVEFDHSILLWHVVTDICYYSRPDQFDQNKKASKFLSDYMLYVLLMRPSMLPNWIDRITYVRDTFNHAIKIFHRRNFPVRTSAEACKTLIQLHTQSQVLDALRSEKSGKSVLFDACRLAVQIKNKFSRDDDEKNLWEMVCGVWIEMLTYAASHGEWTSHAKQLGNGGELLTHVNLLMADLGLSEHFVLGTIGAPIDYQNKGWGWAKTQLASPDARLLASAASDTRNST